MPDAFTINAKLAKQLERRYETISDGGIDWGQGEALAYATLLEDGIPVRLSGQDAERGTFAHRHLVFHDPYTGETYAPIQHLPAANASFEVYNSPLSEYAALGFEYGYSVAAPDALVLWEAQFGDFVNGAQIVIDQFLVAGRSKWGQTSRLTLLLPHGYEGNGPEHSSAQARAVPAAGRAGQHPDRKLHHRRPVLPSSPSSGARCNGATARRDDTEGPAAAQERRIHARGARGRLLPARHPRSDRGSRRAPARLCSGKVYYDIVGHDARPGATDVAVARLEQLYPFPVEAVAELIASLPNLEEIVWAQEEPQNMGAWRSIRHRLDDAARSSSSVAGVTYIGRTWRASPSEGYPTAHQIEQDRIVRAALGVAAAA